MKIGRELKIGLFALAMLVCLYLGINYLKGKEVFSGDRPYIALFDQTRGLQTSAPVLLHGVKIGAVTDIAIDERHPDKVVVRVGVKRNTDIPIDSRLRLFSNSIMGDKAIELVRGSSDSRFERGAIIPSEIENGLLESASLNIEDLVAEAKTTLNSLTATSASLNSLLQQNADGVEGIVTNLEATLKQVSDAEVGNMLSDLRHFSAMLDNNSARFESIVGNLDEISGAVAETDLKATLDTLGMGIAHMNRAFAKLSDGGGTLSELLDNPALYDSLTVAVGNLDALVTDLKSNPKRYVHFSLFGKRDKKNK